LVSEKLSVLIRGLSKYELNALRKFLHSPYHNERVDIRAMFDCLDGAVRKGPAALSTLDREAVWEIMHPGLPFDRMQFRRVASELTRLVLRFMVLEHLGSDPFVENLVLQSVLAKSGLEKHLSGVERGLEAGLWGDMDILESSGVYEARYRMCWNLFIRSTGTLDTDGYGWRLSRADGALDDYYALQKLKLHLGYLVYSRMRRLPGPQPVMSGVEAVLADGDISKRPLLGLFLGAVRCMDCFEEEEHYRDFVGLLGRRGMEIGSADRRELYQFAQNYCAFKINQGHTSYYREVFELYGMLLDAGILLADGQLSEGLYKNIITAGLRVGAYDWVEGFISDYTEKLPARIRENARIFNLANLYSHQKQHDRVIELLRHVEYSDVVYALSAKLILVRTYYETGEWSALDSLLDSFRVYLQRNKLISKSVKRAYLQFLRFVRRLTMLRPGDAEAFASLRAEVAACEPVMSKKWLMEQVGV
jgi:hypothetical protein